MECKLYNNTGVSFGVVNIITGSKNIDNSSIERVEEFKYLGTTLTDLNSIQEEIKSRLK